MSGTKDLSGGLKASYAGKIEFDGPASGEPDHEYELKIGANDLYVAFANDNGQSNRSSMTPFVSYPVGSTAVGITGAKPAFNGDSYSSAVHTSNNIAFGGKVGTGNFVFRFAPNASTLEANDVANVNTHTGVTTGSGIMAAYNGTFGPAGVNIAYTTVKQHNETLNAANDDQKEQRIGLSYNFGKAKVGADYIRFESGAPTGASTGTATTGRSDSVDRNTRIVGIAIPASDTVTFGAYYQTTEDDTNIANRPDEDVKMISIGYNLGGGSVALSILDMENRANISGEDAQGIMLTTKVGF
jgi:predicted porin